MDQAISSAEIDEGAEVRNAADDAFHDRAFAQRLQQLIFLLAAPLAHGETLGENQAIALAVDVDHLELEHLALQPGIA